MAPARHVSSTVGRDGQAALGQDVVRVLDRRSREIPSLGRLDERPWIRQDVETPAQSSGNLILKICERFVLVE